MKSDLRPQNLLFTVTSCQRYKQKIPSYFFQKAVYHFATRCKGAPVHELGI